MTSKRLPSSLYLHGLPAAAVLLLGVALGCDASVDALEHRYESASICPFNWQVFLQLDGGWVDIVEQNGTLYANSGYPPGLVAVPESGGDPIVLGPELPAKRLWIEGDRLIYSQSGDRTDNGAVKFRSLSVNGGESELLFDAATARTDVQPGHLTEITATDFLWTEYEFGQGPTTVWRASRTDRVATKIGAVSVFLPGTPPSEETFFDMAPASDGLVLMPLFGTPSFVPFDGSPARTLAAATGYAPSVGVDAMGAYWSAQRTGTAYERDAYEVVISPADGGPARTHWDGLPDHTGVEQMIRTKDGGWVLYARERFDDKQFHGTVWTLDPTGSARRIACSPPDERYVVDGRPAEGPDAFYFNLAENKSGTTRIIRVAR